jgi:phosphoribosylformimino-5-aminoimidazole carboxamide ribotide isomerase
LLLIPAIDLLDGQVVRLQEGRRERATVYHPHPEEVAARFCDEGASSLHVVDLDGAFAGSRKNAEAVRAICRAASARSVRVQVGGGVRELAACAQLFEEGASAVVLGTAAVKSRPLVQEACRRWPSRIVVAVDARDGRVAVEGWAEATDVSPAELALRVAGDGATAILYTDISRDGLLGGPNVEATAELARRLHPVPVIASGGIASLDHLRALDAAGVPACVVGRALYDGAFTLADALAAAATEKSR